MTDFAERALDRLLTLTGRDLHGIVDGDAPHADLALTNLERWLSATSSPDLYASQLGCASPTSRLLVFLLGTSQPIADTLIQNPEFASLLFEPTLDQRFPEVDDLVAEGTRLLASANSFSHSLDRLRYLRQKWNLLIVFNDLGATWAPSRVWQALSNVADAMVKLAVVATWSEYRKGRELPESCPVTVVAFGKLAGHELNYSSDIDLVYVVPDEIDERLEKDLARFCEMLTRSLSDRMGRGSLYRVDLRLRPYGAAGTVIRRAKGYESYYVRYAEPWEIQALIRTRVIVGDPDRWEAMRSSVCFKPKLSEIALEQVLSMRDRIETTADPEDMKRGAGGIRDVEFLTQVYQLVHGYGCPSVQRTPTLDALGALEEGGWLEHADVAALARGYTFLRQLEHRTQLIGDQQTHRIPDRAEVREALAGMMGTASWRELEKELRFHRRTIHTLYRSILKQEPHRSDVREQLQQVLGPLWPATLQWFEVLPESDAFYSVLLENEGSLYRLRKILLAAPRLVAYFRNSIALTELLLSGEIEETMDLTGRVRQLDADAPAKTIADAYLSAYTIANAQEVLHEGNRLGRVISDLNDALIGLAHARWGAPFDMVALGSYGLRESSPQSDADLILLTRHRDRHREAEATAQKMLAFFAELHRLGVPLTIDLRLRPDGGKGFLVRTYDAFRTYDADGMEMWERFALGNARLVAGSEAARSIIIESAYHLPLTPERLAELVKMKKRIETERVKPQHVRRNIKLGFGGLNDIEWLVRLHEMRYTMSMESGRASDFDERIRQLGRAGLMNALEVESLQEAYRYLIELRHRLFLIGQNDDLVPENPDRLDRLATTLEFADGNAFLAHHETIIGAVRRLYSEGLERLGA